VRKRTKILVIAVVVVILALIAGLATTVLAGESGGGTDTGDNSSAPTLASKVATILGLDESEVTDAFQQARQEMQGQAVDNLLDKAVEEGLIDQGEADQIMEWWQNRPEALGKLGLGAGGRLCLRWGLAGNGLGETFISKVATILELDESEVADAFQQARQEMQGQAVDKLLDKAVEKGRITQDESDQIMEWWQNRPEALSKLGLGKGFLPRNGGCQPHQGKGMGRGFGMMSPGS